MAKRAFDILCSAGGLICLSPIWLLVAILIVLTDGLPVLFIQERIGRH
ncbi:MAG: sugar transferase, partial [Planctomycetaceae bacterium]